MHVEEGESIYAPVPVSLSVELDARGRVKSIAGDTPNPTAVTDAARYIKTLRDSGQLTFTWRTTIGRRSDSPDRA